MSQIPSLSQVSMSSGMRVPDARLPNVPTGQIGAGIAAGGDAIGRALMGIGADAMQQESALELLEATAEFEKRKGEVIAESGKEPSLITRSALIRSGLEQAKEDIAGGFKGDQGRRKFSANIKSHIEGIMTQQNEAISQQHREQFSVRALLSAKQVFNSGNVGLSRKMLDAGIDQGFIDAKTGEESWYSWNHQREVNEIDELVQISPTVVKNYKASYAGDYQSRAVALVNMKEHLSMVEAGRSRDFMKAREVILEGVAANRDWSGVVTDVDAIISNSSYHPDELETVRKGLLGDTADLQALNDLMSGRVQNAEQLAQQPYFKYLSNESLKRATGVFAGGDDTETPAQREQAEDLEAQLLFGDTQIADPKMLWGLAEAGAITKRRGLHLIRVAASMMGDKQKAANHVGLVESTMRNAQLGRPVPPPDSSEYKTVVKDWWADAVQRNGGVSLADIMPTDPTKPSAKFNKLVADLERFVGTHHYLPEDAKEELVGLMNGGLEHHAYQAATLLSKFIDPSSPQARNGTAGMVSSQIGQDNTAKALKYRKHGKPGSLSAARDAEVGLNKRLATYAGNLNIAIDEKLENIAEPIYYNDAGFRGLAKDYAKQSFGAIDGSDESSAARAGYEKAKAEYQVVDGKLMHLSPFAHASEADRYQIYDRINTVVAARALNLDVYNKDGLVGLIESNGYSASDVKNALAAGRHAWKPASKGSAGGSWEDFDKIDLMFFSVMQGVPATTPDGKQLGPNASVDPDLVIAVEKWRKERTYDFSEMVKKQAFAGAPYESARVWYNEIGRAIMQTGKVIVSPAEDGLKWRISIGNEYVVDVDGDSSFRLASQLRSDRFYVPNPDVDREGVNNDPSLWYKIFKPGYDIVKPVIDESKRRPADTMNWTGLQ